MTRTDLLQYIRSLNYDAQKVFYLADRMVIETDDTLSDEFQLAASVVALFEKKAEENRR